MLTITSFCSDGEAIRKRKGVVISSRVHPGEANASWMMQGIIDYLTGPSLDAKVLRDNFVFKLVPMLNADGVVVGNYRCSLAGLDLNRMWREPSRRLTPSIFALKSMMLRLQVSATAARTGCMIGTPMVAHGRVRPYAWRSRFGRRIATWCSSAICTGTRASRMSSATAASSPRPRCASSRR